MEVGKGWRIWTVSGQQQIQSYRAGLSALLSFSLTNHLDGTSSDNMATSQNMLFADRQSHIVPSSLYAVKVQ